MKCLDLKRDLVTGMTIRRGTSTNVVLRNYTYGALGRPLTRSTSHNGTTQNDTFGYNSRSELTSATLGSDNYAYAFDHIGNRATEAVAIANSESRISNYSTNNLNQYTDISMGEAVSSPLQYDADGNATLIQTSTGTWTIEYNAENRPIRWTNTATGTVITMAYDSQGRRVEYKSVTNGTQNTWLRFLYDGYLCIQVLYSNSPYNVFKEFVWDPTEPVATRPLVFRYPPNSLNLFYAFDGNKNVSDVFYRLTSNGIGAHYDYAPFGATTRTHRDSSASFDIVSLNPFRFSSEYYDSELDLIYYNYRHYSPTLGRFLSRDPIQEQGGLNLYAFVENNTNSYDVLGRQCCVIIVHPGTYEDVRDPSMFGHAILDCGENAYLSFFPEGKKEDKVGIGAKPGKNHTKEEDEKRYGKFDFGSRNEIIHPNGGRITRQCLPDCVDDASIVSIIKTLVSTTPNWDFNDSNCADMVMTALDRAMNQEKPKCGKCEVVVDILKKHSEIRTPDGVRDDIALLTKNNCTRYLCSFDPVQAAKALTQSVVNGISYFFK